MSRIKSYEAALCVMSSIPHLAEEIILRVCPEIIFFFPNFSTISCRVGFVSNSWPNILGLIVLINRSVLDSYVIYFCNESIEAHEHAPF
jgi:hypothetical protein